jgi:hypothetical protein
MPQEMAVCSIILCIYLDEYPPLTVSTESSSYPLCIIVAPYSSSSIGAPPERTFLSVCAFFCAYKPTSENSVMAKFAETLSEGG